MNLMSYIVERSLILIPALNVLGLIFKSIERIPDKFIPLLLLIFGISGSIALTQFPSCGYFLDCNCHSCSILRPQR